MCSLCPFYDISLTDVFSSLCKKKSTTNDRPLEQNILTHTKDMDKHFYCKKGILKDL